VASLLTHPAVPLAIALVAGRELVGTRLLLAGIVATLLPDADVAAFRYGIEYSHPFGHRGATHSLTFALGIGGLGALAAPWLHARRAVAFSFLAVACASHGLLDMLTNGGLGVALFWPATDARFFFPSQVLEVSPIGLRRFLSPAGWSVILSELRWVWLPAAVVAMAGVWFRRRRARPV
jgi:inner membrane protein